jgi:addiction module RelE/StbE family toxin
MRILWSPLALDRAAEIAKYIARDKPSSAKQWLNNLFNKVERLLASPKMGRMVPEISDTRIRELIYGNYRIIYRLDKKELSVLTIRHGRQILPVNEIDT